MRTLSEPGKFGRLDHSRLEFMKRTRRYPASGIAASDVEGIENRQRAVRVEMRALVAFTNRVKLELSLGQESVAIRLVNDAEMTRLNETYRNKKGTTDVLSFPAEARRRGQPDQVVARILRYREDHVGIRYHLVQPVAETGGMPLVDQCIVRQRNNVVDQD